MCFVSGDTPALALARWCRPPAVSTRTMPFGSLNRFLYSAVPAGRLAVRLPPRAASLPATKKEGGWQ